MAVFEERRNPQVLLDDTQPLSCTIEAAENVQGHTVYILRVTRGHSSENSWQVTRRYSDFDTLNTYLRVSGIDLPLPPKKVFNKMSREFIAERQQKLQEYINIVLAHPMLAMSLPVKRFLDPNNYSQSYLEMALQHVSMFFRSESQWEVVEPLPEIGWRLRKQYFLVKPKTDLKQRHLLSWVPFGPDKHMDCRDLQNVIKILSSIQHSHIYPISLGCVNENGAIFIRDYLPEGSLRDCIYKTKPKAPFLKKYCNAKMSVPLSPEMIHKFGRQILLALKLLHDRGLHHGHLHAGNVAVQGDSCCLLELENQFLGLPTYYRPFIITLKKVRTLQDIDVYCFGHLVFEMAFGFPCRTATCDSYPPTCPPELRSVLEACLTTEACRNGLPTVSDLLLHPFFNKTHVSNLEKIHIKIPAQLKEVIKKSREQTEHRLHEEQKQLRRKEKLTRALAEMSSDENKKKPSQDLKKNRHQPSDGVQNGPVASSPSPGLKQ